jgi:hypothetical protein
MRKILMIASAAAMAVSMPALAKPDKGGGHGGGGGKPEKHESRGGGGGDRGRGGGGGGGWEGRGGGGEKRFERAQKRAEKRNEKRRAFAEQRREERGKRFEQASKRAEKRFEERRKWAEKAEKRLEKRQERRVRSAERRVDRFEDRRELRRIRGEDRRDGFDHRYRQRYAEEFRGDCPPGLARKNNGCLPPGQARKMFGPAQVFTAGQVLPLASYSDYNIPAEYQSWYQDSSDHYYRYDDGGYIYQVDRGSNLVESLIPLLGGGFGVGQLLPAGYDTYNLPMSYRDDYVDSDEAYYRYGDDAIYQVDPQTNTIESIVALLGGDLNVGGMLPSGYDAYNLPMDYRDDYVDDADSMYRYADGNIYEIDPQSMIIEQIVAQLV